MGHPTSLCWTPRFEPAQQLRRGLLDQFDAPVNRDSKADGAYDGAPTRDFLTSRFGKVVEIVIPPPCAAVSGPQSAHDPSHRDRRIADIRDKGRKAWQMSSGYNQRSRAETLMGRWKTVIGPKLKARNFANQKTDVRSSRLLYDQSYGKGQVPGFTRSVQHGYVTTPFTLQPFVGVAASSVAAPQSINCFY